MAAKITVDRKALWNFGWPSRLTPFFEWSKEIEPLTLCGAGSSNGKGSVNGSLDVISLAPSSSSFFS